MGRQGEEGHARAPACLGRPGLQPQVVEVRGAVPAGERARLPAARPVRAAAAQLLAGGFQQVPPRAPPGPPARSAAGAAAPPRGPRPRRSLRSQNRQWSVSCSQSSWLLVTRRLHAPDGLAAILRWRQKLMSAAVRSGAIIRVTMHAAFALPLMSWAPAALGRCFPTCADW